MSNMTDKDIFDYSKEFKAECLKPIIQLKQFCVARGLPFYMAFATTNNQDTTEYMVAKQFPPECETELKDDLFRKIVLAEHGFDLLENHLDAFNMDEIDIPVGMEMPVTSSEEEDE